MNLVLTNNFYTWMRTILLQSNTNITETTTSASGNIGTLTTIGDIIDIEGNVQNKIATSTSTSYYPTPSRPLSLNAWNSGKIFDTNNYLGIGNVYFGIGKGSKIVSNEDYNLEESYELDVDYSSIWRVINNPTMIKGKARLTYSLSFTAINEITISEIGLFKTMASKTDSYTNVMQYVYYSLLGRAVLDTPITLQPGESTSFQINIEI